MTEEQCLELEKIVKEKVESSFSDNTKIQIAKIAARAAVIAIHEYEKLVNNTQA